MASKDGDTEILEDGDIFFFYRPKVEEREPGGEEDVQRFYMVLHPREKDSYRHMVIGQKAMPSISKGGGGDRYWGFVDKVTGDPEAIRKELQEEHYGTKTRGERTIPAARPAGEGVYAIVKHGDHTHLAYALELPREPGEAQRELGIREQGSYILNVKNPEKGSPRSAGLDKDEKADFRQDLQKRFRDRKFASADPPDFLDYEKAEFLLIGAKPDPEDELDIELHPEDEDRHSAEVFRDLKLKKGEKRVRPLFEGTWG